MTFRFEDPEAEFVVAAGRVFGDLRVLDGARAIQVGEVKLQLEAGERELWVIEKRGVLEHRVGMVEVGDDIEDALREAREQLDG